MRSSKLVLRIGCWNVAGWGKGLNSKFREQILLACNFDIICLCETHLKGNDSISLEGYQWFGSNRKLVYSNARRGSGGVGIFIKDDIVDKYSISVLDNDMEGILWL